LEEGLGTQRLEEAGIDLSPADGLADLLGLFATGQEDADGPRRAPARPAHQFHAGQRPQGLLGQQQVEVPRGERLECRPHPVRALDGKIPGHQGGDLGPDVGLLADDQEGRLVPGTGRVAVPGTLLRHHRASPFGSRGGKLAHPPSAPRVFWFALGSGAW
jgi:hypothetical protein